MEQGRIVKALSGFYYVESGGETVECRAPGRFRKEKITPLVGDLVEFEPLGDGKGILSRLLPRSCWFLRPAVANVDQLVLLAAAVNPVTDPFLIDRVAAIAEARHCEPVIVINKCDLDPGDRLFELYAAAGFTTLRVSAVTGEGVEQLRQLLKGRVSVFTGNSGVGKSSLLNRLDPALRIPTGDVSEKLGRGRHTTRHVELFHLGEDALVADTPGFAAFDTEQAELRVPEEIQLCFREFAPYRDKCLFHDCAHVKEKGCAILEALERGNIRPTRHKSYVALYEQARKIPAWER